LINKKSLVTQCYDFILNEFISQRMKLGEKLNINTISKELNISQTPIREALNRLEKDGFVESFQNIGYYVKNFQKKDIEEIYYIRELIEFSSLRFSFEEGNKKYFKKLLISIEKMKNIELNQEIRRKFIQIDSSLHLAIVKSTENKRLFSIYKKIFNIFLIINQRAHYNDMYYGLIYDHCTRLINSIILDDHDNARKILQEHFRISKNYLYEEYTEHKNRVSILK